ncbi:MAG: hypothetical protein SW833_18560 [Cyanobacteriota bacterium]|nr:hypothetical protein [Cyanobacteriota bacterium]
MTQSVGIISGEGRRGFLAMSNRAVGSDGGDGVTGSPIEIRLSLWGNGKSDRDISTFHVNSSSGWIPNNE